MRYLLEYEDVPEGERGQVGEGGRRARLHQAQAVERAEARERQDQGPALDGGVGRELGPVEEHHREGRPSVRAASHIGAVPLPAGCGAVHRIGRRAHPDGVVDGGGDRRQRREERRRRRAEGLHRRRGVRARVVPHEDERAEQADGDDDEPESEVATGDVAQGGRRRGLGGGLAHGPGQVSQGVPLVPGAPPAPAGTLSGVPPSAPPPPRPPRTRPARRQVEIRPAATVMLVRDAPTPSGGTTLEVLMVRRNLRSDFVGGAYVFPGGAVDPLDGGAEAEALCAGRTDAGASALLGFESGGLAYWVAVVRETFEEAGILLARRSRWPGPPGREPRRGGALRRRARRRQRGLTPLSRPVPRRGAAADGRRHPLLRPLDHAAWCAAPLRHPFLRGGGASGPDRRP